jgi:hypothetical protein
MSHRSTTCSSSPLECNDVFHMRGQTCQRILKWHFDSLYSGPSTLFLCFYLWCLCRDEMNVHIRLWTCLHILIEYTKQKSVLSLWYSHCKLFWAFHVFPMQFEVKSHRKNQQRYDRVVEFIIPMFLNCSACFERHTAHHQEHKNCNCGLWFYICVWLPASAMAQPSQRLAIGITNLLHGRILLILSVRFILWCTDPWTSSLKLNLMQIYCSFKSAVIKSETAHNIHNNKHPVRSNTAGHGCETY